MKEKGRPKSMRMDEMRDAMNKIGQIIDLPLGKNE